MRKVLITGGTGFLGKASAVRLKALGYAVTVLGRNAKAGEELKNQGFKFIQADLADRERIIIACSGHDVVIHSGALASPWGRYRDFHRSNVEGTRNVVDGCFAASVTRMVNISTPSVYFDYRHRTGIRESDPLPPKQYTHYAATKLLADVEVEKGRKRGLEVISLRPRAIFGPGDQTVLGRTLRTAMRGPIPLVAGGASLVDMTYVDNVVDAIVLALEAPATLSGSTFNVTNDEPKSIREILELLSITLGMKFRYRRVPFSVAFGMAAAMEGLYKIFSPRKEPPLTRYAVGLMSRSQTLDISAAKTQLGYSPNVSLEEGFKRFGEWWKSQVPTSS